MITARPWRHHGELTDFPGAVIEAGRAAGLIPVERCVALLAGIRGGQLIPRPSFFQLDNTRKARARGEPWHLIVHEDVLIFRAPRPAARPPATGRVPRIRPHMRSWPGGTAPILRAGTAGRGVTGTPRPRT